MLLSLQTFSVGEDIPTPIETPHISTSQHQEPIALQVQINALQEKQSADISVVTPSTPKADQSNVSPRTPHTSKFTPLPLAVLSIFLLSLKLQMNHLCLPLICLLKRK